MVAILDELPRRPMLAGKDGLRLLLAGAQDKLPVVWGWLFVIFDFQWAPPRGCADFGDPLKFLS